MNPFDFESKPRSSLDSSNYGNPPARTTEPDALARELAERLADPEGMALYRKIANRFSERYIRAALERVLTMPSEKIRVNRGALFNWLVHHGIETDDKPCNPADPRN